MNGNGAESWHEAGCVTGRGTSSTSPEMPDATCSDADGQEINGSDFEDPSSQGTAEVLTPVQPPEPWQQESRGGYQSRGIRGFRRGGRGRWRGNHGMRHSPAPRDTRRPFNHNNDDAPRRTRARSQHPPRLSPAPRDPRQLSGAARRSSLAPSFPTQHLPAVVPQPSLLTLPENWHSQKSATILLYGVPEKASAWEVRQFFENYGRVVHVELEDPDSARKARRFAKVKFEPPPTDTSFIRDGECRIVINNYASWARIEIPRQSSNARMITTPVGGTCAPSLTVRLVKLTFGLLIQPTTFMRKKEFANVGQDAHHSLQLTADFRRKRVMINFSVNVDHFHAGQYRLEMRFEIIKRIHRFSQDGRVRLVIVCADAPLVRQRRDDQNGRLLADRLVWGENELWYRVTDIETSSSLDHMRTPLSLDEGEYKFVDLGRWTTYMLDIDDCEAWLEIETLLRDWNIKTDLDTTFDQVSGKRSMLWDVLADMTLEAPAASSNSLCFSDLVLLGFPTNTSLPFDIRYQLEVCLSRGVLCEYNITQEFLDKLLELSKPDGMEVSRARLILEYAADQGKRIWDPMSLFSDQAALSYCPTTLHIPSHCALVRKVTITPTRIYFSTPTVETTNRVVRHYGRFRDYFIRVQFTDEVMEGRIRSSYTDREDNVYARVFRVLRHGIRMGKWHWKFLAYGNSQIRECGSFFFCEPEEAHGTITCDSIREWMGRFSHIKSIAKLAARLGQCFSTTRPLPGITAPTIIKTQDVERNGYCFTDGVGKISPLLAFFIAEDWKVYPTPSAFQFRMGGCKGVLVTWPDAKGTEVHIRPSQEKFSAEFNGLEIIRCSHFSCATLNRQTITILSCLGVPSYVFLDMMEEQLANYDAAMEDPDKAIDLLTTYVDENMTTLTMSEMVLDGFMETREPFVRSLLQLWRAWSIKALKEKARLVVKKGAFVLGCVDETGTLRGHSRATEGTKNQPKEVRRDQLPQIFLQVPDHENGGTYKVITGLCLVGRNPSLHPGDIRMVEAVDVPQLRHLRDVVVFPLQGDRDVPSMCSGGDLDGDDYFVIWDEKLFPKEWSYPPMNYEAPKAPEEKEVMVANNLAEFFVLFMKNDRLPLIAHAHLATADKHPEGAKTEKCLELAQLHSTAVDYVKTGVAAKWEKRLDPRTYPHFMEKSRARTYYSKSVLGQLYDMVERQVFDIQENYKLPFDERIIKRYELNDDLLRQARKLKSQYDIAMRRIMGQLEIRTEFEVWTAFVMSKPRVGTDYKVQEKVGREAACLKKQFRDLCLKAAGASDRGDFEKLGPFVAAMYRVTCEEIRIALYEARQPHRRPDGTMGLRKITARSMPLISFPWLFPAELGRIATGIERKGTEKVARLRISVLNKPTYAKGICIPVDLKTEADFAAMDYTRTSDGRFIHRGEILNLFHHDDEKANDEYYCNEGVDFSDSGDDSEEASQSGDEGRDGSELKTNIGRISPESAEAAGNVAEGRPPDFSQQQSSAPSATVLDLLVEDLKDATSFLPPPLVPLPVAAFPEQQQQEDEEQQQQQPEELESPQRQKHQVLRAGPEELDPPASKEHPDITEEVDLSTLAADVVAEDTSGLSNSSCSILMAEPNGSYVDENKLDVEYARDNNELSADSDGSEVEYENIVLDIEEESVLERLARFC